MIVSHQGLVNASNVMVQLQPTLLIATSLYPLRGFGSQSFVFKNIIDSKNLTCKV